MKQIIIIAAMLAGLASCTKQTNEDIGPVTPEASAMMPVRNASIITYGSEWEKFTQHNGRFQVDGYDLIAVEQNATLQITFPSTGRIDYGLELSLTGSQTAVLELLNSSNQVVHSRTYTSADSAHDVFGNSVSVFAPNMTYARLRFTNGGYITYALIVSR